MRKRAFTWLEMAVVLFFLMVVAAIMLPVINRPREGNRTSCQSNLKSIALAVHNYMQDSDRRFPPVNAGRVGWSQLLHPYLKESRRFQCPTESKPEQTGTTDYFYNARLSGVEERKVDYPANTIMNGDGAGNAPSNASLSQFSQEWVMNQKSPAYRHLEAANYAYADGHVKMLEPKKITNDKASSSVNTLEAAS